MGEVLGRLELAVAVWRHFTHSAGKRRLPPSQLYEFLGTLRDLMLVADRPNRNRRPPLRPYSSRLPGLNLRERPAPSALMSANARA